ncbi:MAG: carbamate kinase [Lysobacteraceae bacterium]|nr:MAG: carbamate kinase [Xanthomonadaceae bacterium]
MNLVIALGGNALLKRGQPPDPALQRANIAAAAAGLAPVIRRHDVVLTHGNGPQVGLLALQAMADPTRPAFPLDVLGAESEGMIGYVLEQELINQLPGRQFATLLTQVVVDPRDPAFASPTKPIGPVYAEAQATALAAEKGWTVAPDGAHWRRVVASPAPLRILALPAIKRMAEAQVTVICAGGGGIPVAMDADGRLYGVEAVIDKDAASALLAIELGADALVMLTDVAAVMTDFDTPQVRALKRATPRGLAQHAFATGSMGPKVASAVAMAKAGKRAAIGSIDELEAILAGNAGTWIVPDSASDEPDLSWW